MKNFESLIEQEEQKCSYIDDILSFSFEMYFRSGDSNKEWMCSLLSEYFVEMLPLREKLALNNYIGYFDSGMGEYTFIALDISKFGDFLKNFRK